MQSELQLFTQSPTASTWVSLSKILSSSESMPGNPMPRSMHDKNWRVNIPNSSLLRGNYIEAQQLTLILKDPLRDEVSDTHCDNSLDNKPSIGCLPFSVRFPVYTANIFRFISKINYLKSNSCLKGSFGKTQTKGEKRWGKRWLLVNLEKTISVQFSGKIIFHIKCHVLSISIRIKWK